LQLAKLHRLNQPDGFGKTVKHRDATRQRRAIKVISRGDNGRDAGLNNTRGQRAVTDDDSLDVTQAVGRATGKTRAKNLPLVNPTGQQCLYSCL